MNFVLDEEDITSAGFYRADALPVVFPDRISSAQWLLHDFVSRHTG